MMKKKKKNKNHVATQRCVVEQIYDLIGMEKYNNTWFPFNNYDSEFKFKEDTLKLKYKDIRIFDGLGDNFVKIIPQKNCDLLINNPYFSLENEIIKRIYDYNQTKDIKSFYFLLPLSTLENSKITEIMAEIWPKFK